MAYSDTEVIRVRLSAFLDSFEQAYKEWNESGMLLSTGVSLDLDRVYGDLTDVLVSLLRIVDDRMTHADALDDLVNKMLNVAEVILKDEKYRQVVAKTPELINQILRLLDKVDDQEAKKLTLRMITTLGQSNENRLAIGQHDGFRRILRMLLNADAELSSEIVRTLKNLMDSHQASASSSPASSSQQAASQAIPPTANKVSLSQFVPEKVSALWGDVQEVLLSEVSRAFPQITLTKSSVPTQVPTSDSPFPYIPLGQTVQTALDSFAALSKPDGLKPAANQIPSQQQQSSLIGTDDSEVLRELMRVQGALATLTSTLKEAALTHVGKLDMVETIGRLLLRNRQSQSEFRGLNGYQLLMRIFDDLVFSNVNERQVFLTDCFNLFFIVALDGNESNLVGNLDVFDLLVGFTTSSTKLEVRRQALLCLQDLLSVNTVNVAAITHTNAIPRLFSVLETCLIAEDDVDQLYATLKVVPESGIADHAILWMDLENYICSVMVLLQYSSILLFFHGDDVIQHAVRLLKLRPSIYSKSTLMISRMLFNSLEGLFEDRRARISNLTVQAAELDYRALFRDLIGTMQNLRVALTVENISSVGGVLLAGLGALSTLFDCAHDYAMFEDEGAWDFLVQFLCHVDSLSVDSPQDPNTFVRLIDGSIALMKKCIMAEVLKDPVQTQDRDSLSNKSSGKRTLQTLKWPLMLLKNLVPNKTYGRHNEQPLFGSATPVSELEEGSRIEGDENSTLMQCCLQIKLVILLIELLSNDEVKDGARVIGCLEILMASLEGSNNIQSPFTSFHVGTVTCRALEAFLEGSEANKTFLADSIGYDVFLQAVSESSHGAIFLEKYAWHLLAVLLIQERNKDCRLTKLLDSQMMSAHLEHLPSHMGLVDRPKLKEPPFYQYLARIHSQDLGPKSPSPAKLLFDGAIPMSSKRRTTFAKQSQSVSNSETSLAASSSKGTPPQSISNARGRSVDRPKHVRHNSFGSVAKSDASGPTQSTTTMDSAAPSSFRGHRHSHSTGHRKTTRAPIPSLLMSASQGGTVADRKKKEGKKHPSTSSTSEYLKPDVMSAGDLSSSRRISSSEGVSDHVSPNAAESKTHHSSDSSLHASHRGTLKRGPGLNIGHLVSFVLRDHSAAHVILEMTKTMDPVSHQAHIEFFSFLVLLCEADVSNKKLLCENDLVPQIANTMLRRIYGYSSPAPVDWSMLTPYKELIVSLSSYDCPLEISAFLFELAVDPFAAYSRLETNEPKLTQLASPTDVSSPVEGHSRNAMEAAEISSHETQMQILDVLKRIADRIDPNYYFSFDGSSGSFQSIPLDKFPAVRTGYTVACWVKITAFPHRETGLLCFEDGSTHLNPNTFELYFKELSQQQRRGSEITGPLTSKNGASVLSSLSALEKLGTRYCLCLRTHHYPMPPEDFVFDAYDFGKDMGTWHHLAFSHTRQGLSLIVDGRIVQTCSTFNYPRASSSSKDNRFCAVVGRKAKIHIVELDRSQVIPPIPVSKSNSSSGWFGFWSSPAASTVAQPSTISPQIDLSKVAIRYEGFFCGLVSPISIIEGSLSVDIAKKIHQVGPHDARSLKLLGTENRIAYMVHPRAFETESPVNASLAILPDMTLERNATPTPINASTVTIASPRLGTISAAQSIHSVSVEHQSMSRKKTLPNLDDLDIEQFKIGGRLSGGCTAHVTVSIHDVVEQVNGFQFCFRLMECGPAQEMGALQLLSNLLYQRQHLAGRFSQGRGWSVLLHILQLSSSDLSTDIFDALLDISVGGDRSEPKAVILNADCLELVLDLLPNCRESVQESVVKAVVDMVIDSAENLTLWKTRFGMEWCFELLQSLGESARIQVLRLFEALVPVFTVDDLNNTVDFLAYDRKLFHDLKFSITDILYRRSKTDLQMVENLKILNSWFLFVGLLDLPHTGLRLSLLKTLGILLNDSPKLMRPTMAKSVGFDAMWLLLSRYSVSSELFEILLGIGLGWFNCEPESINKPQPARQRLSGSSAVVQKLTDELMYPEVLHLIFDLLKSSTDVELISKVLGDLKRVLTLENMRIVWDQPWLDWVQSLMPEKTESDVDKRIFAGLHAIVQKMVVYDIQRKNSWILKSKGALVDNDMFFLHIMDDVFDYFEANPCLSFDSAAEVIKNLALMYRHLEDHIPFTENVYARFVTLVSSLARHNNSTIRTQMKTFGLFDIRDALVVKILQADLPVDQLKQFLCGFSFDQVADQPQFRDLNGPLLLLRLLHIHTQNRPVQVILGNIIVGIFAPIEENRRAIARLVDDAEVLQHLYSVRVQLSDLSISEDSPSIIGAIPQNQQQDSIADFLAWYYSTEPDIVLKRTAIEQRLESLYLPLADIDQKIQEKMMHRRNKRVKVMKDRQLRQAGALNRMLTDFKSKSALRVQKSAAAHQEAQDLLRKGRYERRRIGEELWKEQKASVLQAAHHSVSHDDV